MSCSLFIIHKPINSTILSINSNLNSLSNRYSITFIYCTRPFVASFCIITNSIIWIIWKLFLFLFFIINNTNHNSFLIWFHNLNLKTILFIIKDLIKKYKLITIIIILYFYQCFTIKCKKSTPFLILIKLNFLFIFSQIKIYLICLRFNSFNVL